MTGATAAKPERQPPGLFLLFGVEMWERFSFYGMRAFLALFLASSMAAGGFGWTKQDASHLVHAYNACVYGMPLLGGYLADRYLGTHRALVIGSVIIAAGHFCLAVPAKWTFFLGLALIVFGTGFHKSNISTMVGQLYRQGDPRRDGAFTIFHVGINVGAFLGPILCGYFAEDPRYGWHWGFATAGVGMVLGLVMYLSFKKKYLPGIGDAPAPRERLAAAALPVQPFSRDERDRIIAIVVLAFFNVFFWAAYEQTSSSMTFFASERVDRHVLGLFEFRVSWFQSINPFTIWILGPLFALMWTRLGTAGREPITPIKFVWGLGFMALGFAVMVVAARMSDTGILVGAQWLIAVYVLHTVGELFVYPVGLSMVTKLAPARIASLMMGVWFLSFFAAEGVAGLLAGSVEKIEKGQLFRLLGGQADFFLIFSIAPLIAALVLWALARKVHRLMHGRA